MSLDEIPDLRCLVMIDGTVFGNLNEDAAPHPMEILLGDAMAPFEPCDQDPTGATRDTAIYPMDTSGIALRSFSDPYEDIPGDVYACWVDHLSDWAVPDSQTVQVMINRYDAPCHLYFKNRIEVPSVTDNTFFEARLAIHRAQAILGMTFRDTKTGREEQHEIPFDTTCHGGRLREGYAHIRQQIPPHFNGCEVTLDINYLKHLPDNKGIEPFLFLTDLRVVAERSQKTENTLLEPEWLYGETPNTVGQWIKAPLPHVLSPGQGLRVKLGGDDYPIHPTRKSHFHVRENYGHTLVCEAAEEMELILCIDGEHVEVTQIAAGDTIIRLPNKYLNGHVRHLCLKDKSGSVVLFEHHQLMPSIITPEDVMRRESVAPFPNALFAQTPLRYAGLKAVMAAAGPETDFDQLTHALKTVEGGYENVTLRPLHFPDVKIPDVSIVIPAHNNIRVTYLALCSLLLAHNTASFEVIVVDDGSTDETATLETLVSGINVIHHTSPQRFIRACNAGAAEARGSYIALLNNDVEVTVGWLDELLAAFDRFDNVGMVGSKLLYPDGNLQDAGGIIWGSGNPWNYGNRQNPNEPRFSYARQADYLSGAALLMPLEVWKEVGGLSAELEPMYFEDTDLAFKVRDAGYATWFVPSSIVYHFEGATSGTDVTTGFKKYQEINRPKFKRRWASAFTSFGAEGVNPDLEKDRGIVGRVCFIDYAPPRPDKDAGSYAAVQEMRLVQSLGYKVTFVSTNMAHLGKYTEDLQKQGVEVIYAPFYMNAAEYLEKHSQDFDAFFVTRYYVAQSVIQMIRDYAPAAKVLFNNADLHFLRELRAARSESDDGKLDRARQTRDEEINIIRNADVVLSYTDIEHSVIQAYTDGAANVVKCPWVVSVPDKVPPLKNRNGLSFLGSYKHHPNAEGIIWFSRTIMPLLNADTNQIPLTIYGSGMDDNIRALASETIMPHGFVGDVSTAFDRHRIFIAPLLSGAGIKGKVASALAHGIPCVISPIAAEGIGLRSGHDCIIASTPEQWLAGITQLNTDAELWKNLSQNARSYMRDAFSFENGRTMMRTAFEAADMYGSFK